MKCVFIPEVTKTALYLHPGKAELHTHREHCHSVTLDYILCFSWHCYLKKNVNVVLRMCMRRCTVTFGFNTWVQKFKLTLNIAPS